MSQEQFAENLKVIVAEKLKGIQNFNEDVKYVAEYIVLLIVNGGTLESIVQELSTLFDAIPVDSISNVVQTAFFALEALQQGESVENIVGKIQEMNAAANQEQAPQEQVQIPTGPAAVEMVQQPVQQQAQDIQQQAPQQQIPQPQIPQQQETTQLVSAFSGVVPTLPSDNDAEMNDDQIVPVTGYQPRFSQRGGAVGKGRRGRGGAIRGNTRSSFKDNARYNGEGSRFNPLAKALGMGSDSNVNFIRQKKEGRCKVFPHCPLGKSCPHAHPTKVCNDYPNCPKPAGTCEYLHPNEDEELMKEIERTREEFQKRKAALLAARTKPIQTGIVICKFGVLCSNPLCPFGHPTPANEDAKVIDLMWCENNLKCEDPQCKKAHSSLSKIKSVAPMGRPAAAAAAVAPSFSSRPPVEKSLEQCKYGTHCTNKRCKFRHARSPVMCREGANCQRIDCIFGHPINEDCRFGINCTNAHCLFRHPEGRVLPQKATPTEQPQQQQQIQQQPQQQPMDANNNGLQSSWGNVQQPQQPGATNQRIFALPEGTNIEQAPAQENFAPSTSFVSQDNDTQMG